MIWKLVAEPRFIEIKSYDAGKLRNKEGQTTEDLGKRWGARTEPVWRASTKGYQVPIVFQINEESREVAEKIYQLVFEKELDGRRIWVDFSRDTIFFPTAFALLSFYAPGRPWTLLGDEEHARILLPEQATAIEKQLQHLAIGSPLDATPLIVLSRFQNLQKLILPKKSIYTRGCVSRWVRYDDLQNRVEELERRLSKTAEERGLKSAVIPEVVQLGREEVRRQLYSERYNGGFCPLGTGATS